MPHRHRIVALSLALLLMALGAGPRPAAAESRVVDRMFSVGAGGGIVMPSGDANNAFNNGYNAQGFLRLNFPAFPIEPRLDLTYQKLDLEDASLAAPGLDGGDTYGGGQLEALSLSLQAQIAILPLGPVQVYALAGGGWTNFQVSLEGGPDGATADDSASEFTYSAGLGGSIGLGRFRAYAEGRLHKIENDGELIALDSVELVPVTIGILF